MSGGDHNQADQTRQRDDFLEAMLPALIGECMTTGAGAGWCGTHDAAWTRRRDHCDKYADADDLADSVLEAWQARGEVSS